MDTSRATFEIGIKAVDVREDDDGTLYVEGYAADFETDRDQEAFEPGAFERGLKSYMENNPVLLYHHNPSQALGRVVQAEIDGKGLRIRAAIPKPPAGNWAELVYTQVKGGIVRGFSVGGAFARHLTREGQRIHDVDLQEISVTPLPVNPRTLFAVAGKAFPEDREQAELERLLARLQAAVTTVETALV